MSYMIYVCDTECTGLDLTKHDIIEVSFARFSFDAIDKIEQKTWKIKAVNITEIQDKALSVNGHKKEDICHLTKYGKENYGDPKNVVSEVEAWIALDDCSVEERVWVGKNTSFDLGFMMELWKRTGNEDTFPFLKSYQSGLRVIDLQMLVCFWDTLMNIKRDKLSLTSIIKEFAVQQRKAHNAEDDTKMTLDLFLLLALPIKEAYEKNKDNILKK